MIRRTRRIFMVLVLVLICATAVCFADDTSTETVTVDAAGSIMITETAPDEILSKEGVAPAAVVDPDIDPQYSIPMAIDTSFEAGSGIAECSVTVDVDAGAATTVNMRIVLERLTTNGYVVVKTWRDEVRTFDSFGEASIYRVFALEDRGTYRFRTSGTVYRGSTVVATYTDVTSATDPY